MIFGNRDFVWDINEFFPALLVLCIRDFSNCGGEASCVRLCEVFGNVYSRLASPPEKVHLWFYLCLYSGLC
jgi:hypothetical protein